jgi:hypothetical protein
MNQSLRFLDRFDRKRNIYELIMLASERGHKALLGGLAFEEEQGETLRVILEQIMKESGGQ